MIKKENLENLLISNWTNILDAKQIINETKAQINKHIASFEQIQEILPKEQFLISRFEIFDNRFIIWVEFNTQTATGTAEFDLYLNGTLVPMNIVGYVKLR